MDNKKLCEDYFHSSIDPKSRRRKKDQNTCPGEGEYEKNGKRYMRIITHNYVRDIIIPSDKPNENTGVFTENDLQKLNEKTKEVKRRLDPNLVLKIKKDKEELATNSELRKKEMRKFPSMRTLRPRLNQLEIEAEAKANFLSNRAKEIRQEDDDDIKLCNNLVLGTKCQAIRDAQVAEKKTMLEEFLEEEKRLNDMMEQERRRALAREEEERLQAIEKKKAYIAAINEQLRNNALEREMESERQIEEQKLLNEYIMKCRMEEVKAMWNEEIKRQQTSEELDKINQRILEEAENAKRDAKIAELKIQQFMKDKAEQEAEREAKLLEIKMAKERELAKLRAAQEKAQGSAALKDEIKAKKIQEEYELQWRAKEKAEAELKRKKNEQLKADRERQIQERKQWQEAELKREQEDKARFMMLEQQYIDKEKEEAAKRANQLLLHKAALLKQINNKEYDRIKERRQTFEEAIAKKNESELRDLSIKNTIKKKIAAVRSHNVPEKYIKEIERKLKVDSSN
ncbi:hypothetical protein O3M35_003189 [Rhynocoris fuscipes]|uniref:Cilia- and flagella-associated protein 45 n=1 Tax=Rhynocoris fuscipes TaxID=488301 RepID=A0AAW1CJK6_9HEMI